MRLCSKTPDYNWPDVFNSAPCRNLAAARAFTLMEVMVVMTLLTIMMVSGFGAIMSMRISSSRLANYTEAMAVVEAKLADIRAATYKPPNYPFGSTTLYLTNIGSIALDKAGANFLMPGTVVSKIQPVLGGHLITVTATYQAQTKPISVSLETVVNKYSGGQQ